MKHWFKRAVRSLCAPVRSSALRARRDAIVFAIASLALFTTAISFDLFEWLPHLMIEYEETELDEAIGFVLIGSGAFGVFAWRRWGDLARETAQREKVQRELSVSEARFSALFEKTPTPTIILKDESWTIEAANEAFARLTDLSRDDLMGFSGPELGLWEDADWSVLAERMAGEEVRARNVELSLRSRSGEPRVTLASAEWIVGPARKVLAVSLVDITERKAMERELTFHALHDRLTGLPNRALFGNRVQHALTGAKRRKRFVAALFLDLDGFKSVNDGLGHGAGDALLKAVATRLRGTLRASDSCARLGGDEFAVLIEDCLDEDDLRLVASRLLAELSAHYQIGGSEIAIGVSIGVAVAVEDMTAEKLLQAADIAMYRAKALGRGRYELFDPQMGDAFQERAELERELRVALERDQFEIHYQPILDLSTRQIIGFESLVRWRHPVRGVIPPLRFIPLAEESGLILPLGRWILERSCRDACRLERSRRNQTPLRVSVNVSARQLRETSLIDDVKHALEVSGLDPARLELELTESILIVDLDLAVRRLGELKSLGVRIAIDDFGTGYSSLRYLHRLPVDSVKIDRSFVSELQGESRDSAVIRAIIGMSETLQFETVAEGVEQEDQERALRDLGCDLAQGFLFARPMTYDRLVEMIASTDAKRQNAEADEPLEHASDPADQST